MTDMGTTMGDQVREAREAMGLTQEQLAHEAKVSVSTVTRLERGVAPEDGDGAKKVLRALGLSGGHSLSGGQKRAVTTQGASATMPSTMAQMIGRLQVPAGSEDYYTEVTQIALERGAPGDVFKELAQARVEAPADARTGWWMRRLMDAMDRASGKPPGDGSR